MADQGQTEIVTAETAEEVLERPGGYPSFIVPKNEEGDRKLLSGCFHDDDIRWCSLRDEENKALFWVYDELNSVLGIIIDDCEEEYIEAEDAPKALEIVKRWQENPKSEAQERALGKLQRALEAAIHYGTYLKLAL